MRDKLFYIIVAIVGISALFVVVPTLWGGVVEFWNANNPIEEAIDENKEAFEILGEFGGYMQTNPVIRQGSDFFSDLEKYAESETSETTVPASNADNATVSATTIVNEKLECKVVRVVDGDTYVLNIDGTETKVRLIGVDTPESVAPENYHKNNSNEGIMVSDIVKSYIKEGDTVYVEYDVGRTDTYGRTLAYVYFGSGMMIQEWLLQNGYAQVMTIQPNSKYADHFVQLEQKAMSEKIGIWGE